MTGDDLRALATAAHLHDLSYAMLVDWLVDHVDALADLIDAVDVTWGYAKLVGVNRSGWIVRSEDMTAIRDAFAALDADV